MTRADLLLLLPLLCSSATVILVLAGIAVRRSHVTTCVLTLLGFAGTVATSAWLLHEPGILGRTSPLLSMDQYALFFSILIGATGFVIALFAYGYLERRRVLREEFYLLLAIATTGGVVLAAATHFATFFLGVELMSVALYTLVGYQRDNPLHIEASLKYLTLAGVAFAFLLFGMALVYVSTGSLALGALGTVTRGMRGLWLAGLAMITVGVGFKLALAPFHLWIPDVYQGAAAPVTALVATIAKGAVFAVLVRLFFQIGLPAMPPLVLAFTAMAVFSMFVGNILGLLQTNLKRILAYSSIANMGYLLVALLALAPPGGRGIPAVTAPAAMAVFLVAYFISSLGALGVVSAVSGHARDADQVEDYRGFGWRRPWLGVVMTAMMLSLAGIPLTAGFLGKFLLLAVGVGAGRWLLALSLVLSSVIGVYYYLRVIVAMYQQPTAEAAPLAPRVRFTDGLALTALTLLLFGLGIYPSPLLNWLQAAMATLAR